MSSFFLSCSVYTVLSSLNYHMYFEPAESACHAPPPIISFSQIIFLNLSSISVIQKSFVGLFALV